MKKQFFVLYVLSGGNPHNKFQAAFDVRLGLFDSAMTKKNKILIAIAEMHNKEKVFVDNVGKIEPISIGVEVLTRL